jgi:RNA polymerase sigma-70 factor (ECF subfamily)
VNLNPPNFQEEPWANTCLGFSGAKFVATTVEKSPYLRDPEVQLMLRVKNGDDDAFATLVRTYQDRLVSIFTNMVGDQESAEDLAQEVFLRVYRARNGYEPTAKFSTWVFRIANNLASNTRRTKGRRKEVQLRPADSGSVSQVAGEQMLPEKSALMPTRQAARTELQQRVWDAMGELNERQRMAILLHRFEDMSYADIGAAMELSTEAVKSLLSRARENLRVALEPYVGK